MPTESALRKAFVLDTNVILHEPRAAFRFPGNDVVVPIYVVEELDQFKKDLSGLGRNAREFSRMLDEVREKGDLRVGVPIEGDSTLRVVFAKGRGDESSYFAKGSLYDNLILQCALELKEESTSRHVVFVTKDTNLRIRGDVLGLDSQDYDPDQIQITDLYQGHREIEVEPDDLQKAFADGVQLPGEFVANEFVMLRDASKPNHTALARYDLASKLVRGLPRRREVTWGLTPRNKEQIYAMNLLLDDSVKLVTLVGKAGTGKTLLALAAGLQKVTEEDVYQRVLVSRPILPLGKDLGFLPGTVEEKLDPWMKPIHDNVELLLSLNHNSRREGRGYEELFEMGLIEVEPLTYIRGRSIPRQFLIIDESQNLTPHEVKTILTRAGEGTKIVFTGDPYQIDNPYVDTTNNGLVHLVNRFQNQPIAGTVTLSKGERSELAELAANLL